ncbi:hypothetical protein CIPAW_01G076800 [Carya illinoinensis]|uniref:Uncharacterized protein n=1 Tax=Carya illinoinensis TaxID=32201 RepID=A0A8T1RMK3_CARIL|nr:hypothetical protein CIPAW_01G076800 [Carya illinoinensis]KAG6667091.1 hypothetical protein CIPAW_01G076800 [Carya illinoinensis]
MFLRRLAVALPHSRSFLSGGNNHDLASAISELNKEMESVFGEPPPIGHASSNSNQYMAQEPQFVSQKVVDSTPGLTHISSTGEAQMVDVSRKESSKRTAIASCKELVEQRKQAVSSHFATTYT